MPEYTLIVEGDISPEDIRRKALILGELVIGEVRKNIKDMDLIGRGALLQRWNVFFSGQTLTIESGTTYGQFIEYGTFEYWDNYGWDDFPEIPFPKKKDLTAAAKKLYEKGMQPFAPVRRVLYNERLMNDLIAEAFS